MLLLWGGCVQAGQRYPLASPPGVTPAPQGAVQIERIEGRARLFALQVSQLAPPEDWGPGCREFLVWAEDSHGRTVKVGTLRYDRTHRSATLLSAVEDRQLDFQAFTVKVTAERELGDVEVGASAREHVDEAQAPCRVVLSERHVVNQ